VSQNYTEFSVSKILPLVKSEALCNFPNILVLYGEELLESRLQDHPLSVVHDCLVIIFAVTHRISKPSSPIAT
jgi:hypothetical protein